MSQKLNAPKWNPFSTEETERLSMQNHDLSEITLMICPHCGKKEMRVYIHDSNINMTVSYEWIWCSSCNCFVHYRVERLTDKYRFNDPLAGEEYKNVFSYGEAKWYDFLESLYKQKILPQEITLRPCPKGGNKQ